ncbi:MAG: hypothetical protein A3A86_06920 [Elusimicrobia bacterium RIFCSPLOWO2_01_FULL_60_11]|nr:MAG: hypothetical protein A3A86_06920 [Elusimicrobia bacterium RIFCSPLOWO2_01_FULL_60_11]
MATWPALADDDPSVSSTTAPGDPNYPEAMATPREKWKGASKRVLDWEARTGRSYLIPAVEIPIFIMLLNVSDRLIYGNDIYGTDPTTTWDHVRKGPWQFDADDFRTNQAFHPYQGTIYFGLARSAGLTYWESLLYTSAGSFLWETAGENGPPSINDQVASGIAGSFFGEELFRMANMTLERGGKRPGFWRELGAAFISPPIGVNRLVFGDRFKTVLPSRNPATFTRVRLGASLTEKVSNQGVSSTLHNKEATGEFFMAYGLPGKPGYRYIRPFDYFHFEAAAVANNGSSFENIMTRGFLLGRRYEVGDSYRGIWGLYGNYDYISPRTFRVSTTGASLGTTGQLWLSRKVALQGTVLAGPGFGAAGTVAGEGDRDYHYGAAAQGLLSLRLIFGKLAMLDATGREFYISGVGSAERRGTEQIARGNVSFTVRIYGRHAVGVQYIQSRRDADYSNIPERHQTTETFSLAYNFLGDTRFGAVEWRDEP